MGTQQQSLNLLSKQTVVIALCHIYLLMMGNRQVANIFTSAVCPQGDKHPQVICLSNISSHANKA